MRLLEVDTEGYGGLRLGSDCRDVLRGERKVQLRRDPGRGAGRDARQKRATLADPGDERLFEALRAHRLALAKEQGVPPYVIFHDSTLVEMTRVKPRQLHELGRLSGIGQAKLERYGASFLALLRETLGPASD